MHHLGGPLRFDRAGIDPGLQELSRADNRDRRNVGECKSLSASIVRRDWKISTGGYGEGGGFTVVDLPRKGDEVLELEGAENSIVSGWSIVAGRRRIAVVAR